jgi:oxygen-independent coproporphyrinogen III oxidase
MNAANLVSKYNVPGPRYTSYPTVPYWKITQWETPDWISVLKQGLNSSNKHEISLYIHLPYCDSLCTFCGCHKHITTNHKVEKPYISAVLKEWDLLLSAMNQPISINSIHLGGGTPTFFSPSELNRLISGITAKSPLTPYAELGFEAHPNSTSLAHLTTLNKLGFTRVSFGIQDYDPVVQTAIHRIQSFEQVSMVHHQAKSHGFTSISHDLVFGLPKQTLCGFRKTIEQTLALKPERISLYSYAHVPWIKGTGQRGFDENDLPAGATKRSLYELAKGLFTEAGYVEIGMDHFAIPTDELAIAVKNKTLHRNFMGYTTQTSPVLIGLGMSAISDAWFGFAQNEHSIKAYLERLHHQELPITRGHHLTEEDLEIRQHILNLMCHFETEIPEHSFLHFGEIIQRLFPMIEDGLVSIENNTVSVTEKGIPFVRNCCMAFDAYLRNPIARPTFSLTI